MARGRPGLAVAAALALAAAVLLAAAPCHSRLIVLEQVRRRCLLSDRSWAGGLSSAALPSLALGPRKRARWPPPGPDSGRRRVPPAPLAAAQNHEGELPGVEGHTYYLVNETPGQSPETVATVETWQATAVQASGRGGSGFWTSLFAPAGRGPVGW